MYQNDTPGYNFIPVKQSFLPGRKGNRSKQLHESAENHLECRNHCLSCSGRHSGHPVGWRPCGGFDPLCCALRLYGAHVSHRFADLRQEGSPFTIEAGDPITFMLLEDTIATHRVVGVVPDENDNTVVRFRTKGDANEAEDGSLVHYKNFIGSPVFSIPYLGYVSDYITNPPGMYIGFTVLAVIILMLFAPDLLKAADAADKKAEAKNKESHEAE